MLSLHLISLWVGCGYRWYPTRIQPVVTPKIQTPTHQPLKNTPISLVPTKVQCIYLVWSFQIKPRIFSFQDEVFGLFPTENYLKWHVTQNRKSWIKPKQFRIGDFQGVLLESLIMIRIRRGLSDPWSGSFLRFNYQSCYLLLSHMFLIHLWFYTKGETYRSVPGLKKNTMVIHPFNIW